MPYDAKQGVGAGLSGAALGAKTGSAIFPGVGTAVGAAVGGVAGLFSGFSRDPEKKKLKAELKDKKKRQKAENKIDKKAQKYFKKFGKYPAGYTPQGVNQSPINPNAPVDQNNVTNQSANPGGQLPDEKGGFQFSPNLFTPAGQDALAYLLNKGKTQLENPYEGFGPIEENARTKFKSETLPSIAERFTALGGSDTLGSSDFASVLGGSSSEFERGIAALKSQYGLDSQDRALNLLRLGLTPQTELHYFNQQPEAPSVGSRILENGFADIGDYIKSGGASEIGKAFADRRARQEQQSLVDKILNKDRLNSFIGGVAKRGATGKNINTYANLIATKRMQKGR